MWTCSYIKKDTHRKKVNILIDRERYKVYYSGGCGQNFVTFVFINIHSYVHYLCLNNITLGLIDFCEFMI